METERQLLEAIRSGDRQAMRRFYERFSRYAMAVALRYVSDRDNAQDVIQESFVKILTSIECFSYRGEGSLTAWVGKIVSHCAIDWMKGHERLLSLTEVPYEEEPDLSDMEAVPPEVLHAMIARLPAGCRVVLNLFVFEQLSHKDIAHRLGIKENSSASQFSRAKVLLAEMIKEYLDSQRI